MASAVFFAMHARPGEITDFSMGKLLAIGNLE
jgi:hypothetical protein